jgi:rubrerythrin
MVGAIDKRDILAHPIVTIRCFGWRVFVKALLAGRSKTFLSVLAEAEVLQPAAENVVEFIARCVELELKASRIYTALARRFADDQAVHGFFESLAAQEDSHAELLELCRAAAAQQRWDETQVAPWRDVVPRLERHMVECEGSVDGVHTLPEALRLVIDIESSEINDVFSSVVAAADSEFVRRLSVFGETERRHLDFICRAISRLAPELADDSRVLQKGSRPVRTSAHS